LKNFSKNLAWVLSDGTKGMENQSVALAKMLNCDFKVIKYNAPFLLKNFPLIGKFFPKSFININLNESFLPSFVITTGKRMAGISIAIKSCLKDKIKTIHIQNPKVSRNNFDLLLIPEHDKIFGNNIIKTKGALSFFDGKKLLKNNKLSSKKITIFLMVGGNNKRYSLNYIDYYDLSMSIVKATKLIKGKLIVASSRRTTKEAINVMQYVFKKNLTDFKFYSSNDINPYPDILKYSDFIIVTSDSVNMISETATIQAPLFVYYFPKETGKILGFLDNLVDLGIIKKFDGRLFKYKKSLLDTNSQTILKINKFFGSKYIS